MVLRYLSDQPSVLWFRAEVILHKNCNRPRLGEEGIYSKGARAWTVLGAFPASVNQGAKVGMHINGQHTLNAKNVRSFQSSDASIWNWLRPLEVDKRLVSSFQACLCSLMHVPQCLPEEQRLKGDPDYPECHLYDPLQTNSWGCGYF